MKRALAILLLAGCAAEPRLGASGVDVLFDVNSVNVRLERVGEGVWTLTVGRGGDLKPPRIFLDDQPVELELGGPLTGFGQYFQEVYEITRPGRYRVEHRDKPEDEKPRIVYSFTLGN